MPPAALHPYLHTALHCQQTALQTLDNGWIIDTSDVPRNKQTLTAGKDLSLSLSLSHTHTHTHTQPCKGGCLLFLTSNKPSDWLDHKPLRYATYRRTERTIAEK